MKTKLDQYDSVTETVIKYSGKLVKSYSLTVGIGKHNVILPGTKEGANEAGFDFRKIDNEEISLKLDSHSISVIIEDLNTSYRYSISYPDQEWVEFALIEQLWDKVMWALDVYENTLKAILAQFQKLKADLNKFSYIFLVDEL